MLPTNMNLKTLPLIMNKLLTNLMISVKDLARIASHINSTRIVIASDESDIN